MGSCESKGKSACCAERQKNWLHTRQSLQSRGRLLLEFLAKFIWNEEIVDRTLIRSQVCAVMPDRGILVILHLEMLVWSACRPVPGAETHRLLEGGRSLVECSAIQTMIEVRVGRVSGLKGLERMGNWNLFFVCLVGLGN